MGPPSTKSALRTSMREVRRRFAADPAERARRSTDICSQLIDEVMRRFGGDLRGRRLMAYDPLPGEPDVSALVDWARSVGVAVFVPAIDGPELRVVPGDEDPSTLDVIVVPGLAFTSAGERLGQGGGHFDRFLARLAPRCLRVGVAFTEQLVDVVPTESHDIAVDLVITDR